MVVKLLLISGTLLASPHRAPAQTTKPAQSAVDVYMQAAKILNDDHKKNIMSPASSNANFQREYPPLPDNWVQMEKQDYDLHANVRDLVHQADLMQRADWPAMDPNSKTQPLIRDLNECRAVANEMGDAAQYQSLVLQDEPAAFNSAADVLRLADLLKNEPGENLVRLLVGEGIDALNSSRLMVIIANSKITTDPQDPKNLPLATATQWIAQLLNHPDAQSEFDQAMKSEPPGAAQNPTLKTSQDRVLQTIRRVQTERDLAAMSLAAHVYQFKHNNWPANLTELKTELPRVPIDPFGDGHQPLGYVMIWGGLPDSSDRPLVYSRYQSKDGLFFRTDAPHYNIYNNADISNHPPAPQKQGGQFRDVASWAPAEGAKAGATTQPLH
jgi:hypothetical protein